ncbi:hypothetical protein MTR67_012588 [Solanum verrucosum]|uniref:Uncharacterized protein n=1 Tax=Solanum verrucosum TaxID=315347 RepID=A0AAF0QAN2_SOLVR|nr:hypothetical protein MTR67_012588 [Solanum verrucosum]
MACMWMCSLTTRAFSMFSVKRSLTLGRGDG